MHTNGVNFVFCDGSVRLASSHFPTLLSDALKNVPPNTISKVKVFTTNQPSWQYVVESQGIIAILIGLLLPAVQKVREAAARTSPRPTTNFGSVIAAGPGAGPHVKQQQEVDQGMKLLKPYLKPGAQIYIDNIVIGLL